MHEVNLEAKLATFSDYFQARTGSEFNGHDIMVVKIKGEFVWHKHDDTDDFFLVLKGNLTIELRDRKIHLGPGELFVVPRGVEHRPVAEEEVHILLIEPTGTPNTGDAATAAVRRGILTTPCARKKSVGSRFGQFPVVRSPSNSSCPRNSSKRFYIFSHKRRE